MCTNQVRSCDRWTGPPAGLQSSLPRRAGGSLPRALSPPRFFLVDTSSLLKEKGRAVPLPRTRRCALRHRDSRGPCHRRASPPSRVAAVPGSRCIIGAARTRAPDPWAQPSGAYSFTFLVCGWGKEGGGGGYSMSRPWVPAVPGSRCIIGAARTRAPDPWARHTAAAARGASAHCQMAHEGGGREGRGPVARRRRTGLEVHHRRCSNPRT